MFILSVVTANSNDPRAAAVAGLDRAASYKYSHPTARKLTCDPTTHASRATGDDGDSAFKSPHLSEDSDTFSEAVSDELDMFTAQRTTMGAGLDENARPVEMGRDGQNPKIHVS
ncbi:MAG TPA: hypothetical protein VKU19_29335 [Bryobacteraceae bacterium]|nr:hypothetical protein [Bryobacteraceae bacterium]